MELEHNRSKRKTKRGKSRRQKENKNPVTFSILGSNANGINGKAESLQNAMKYYDNPSCITIQECKLKSHNFKIPGYQVFQKNRNGLGGGLITAIDENLPSILVSSTDKEILSVQIEVDGVEIRILNAYGPQEDDKTEHIYQFWQDFENEIILAKEQNCKIIVQMDANAKLGNEII